MVLAIMQATTTFYNSIISYKWVENVFDNVIISDHHEFLIIEYCNVTFIT